MFQSNLRELRRKNNLKLSQVCAKTGGEISESVLSKLECNKSIMSTKHAEALAVVYKTKPAALQESQLLEMLRDVCQKSGAPAMLESINAMLENNSIEKNLRIKVARSALKAVEDSHNTPNFGDRDGYGRRRVDKSITRDSWGRNRTEAK